MLCSLPVGVGLEEGVWGVTQLTLWAVSQGQGEESRRLLECSLGHRAGQAVPESGKEETIGIGEGLGRVCHGGDAGTRIGSVKPTTGAWKAADTHSHTRSRASAGERAA